MKDKTLSSKISATSYGPLERQGFLSVEDVKEFISKLKEWGRGRYAIKIQDDLISWIDKHAGDDLIHSQHPSAGDEADRVSLQSLGEKPTKTEDTPGDAVNSGHLASDNKGFEDVMDIDDIKRGSGNKGCTNYEK